MNHTGIITSLYGEIVLGAKPLGAKPLSSHKCNRRAPLLLVLVARVWLHGCLLMCFVGPSRSVGRIGNRQLMKVYWISIEWTTKFDG